MPWIIRKRDNQFCLYKEGADGEPEGDTLGCHSSQAEAEAQRRALEANVQEFRGSFTDVVAISELRGSYPNVPIAADVDYAALIAGDDDPQFLTLPIGMVNAKSGNGRFYDEEFVTELMRQTLTTRPIGLFGHLSETERATAFPKESLHWVGAVRDGDGTLWGKAYVVPGETRQRLARYKASGKSIATSIDAFAEGQWDESLKAMRMKASSLRLNQIDLAPADRAGIADLARVPLLTTEMQDDTETDETPEENPMDRIQIIREMTPEDADLIPKPVRAAILETVQPAPEVAQMEALREALGLDDKADVVSVVTEMRRNVADQARAAVPRRITELVSDAENGIKLESARGIVTELVKARGPQTEAEAEAAYAEVVAQPHVTEMLKAHVQAAMGPRQGAGQGGQNNGGEPKYFRIPKKETA